MQDGKSERSSTQQKDYKKLYENLSARISALHAYADRISGPDLGFGSNTLERDRTSRILKKIAFGRLSVSDITDHAGIKA